MENIITSIDEFKKEMEVQRKDMYKLLENMNYSLASKQIIAASKRIDELILMFYKNNKLSVITQLREGIHK